MWATPFTASHPAAVLPLVYLGLPTSPLVIGSMVPDLPYFLPLARDLWATHSVVGLFTVDPLLGLMCLALWWTLIGPLALAVAPAAVRRRLPGRVPWRPRRPRPGDAVSVVVVAASLILASATHVLWDEFTHAGRFGARHLPWLAAQHGLLPGYEWAQYVGGAVGGGLLMIALTRWWRATAPGESPPALEATLSPWVVASIWVGVLAGTLVGAAIGFLSVIGEDGMHRALFMAVTRGGGGGLIVVGLAALACAPRTTAT